MNAIDMETIRRECAERIAAKLRTTQRLSQFTAECENGETIDNHGRRDFNADIMALGLMSDAITKMIRDDIWLDINQYVTLLVRDVIKPDAENHMEPIVFLSGNSMGPTYRAIDHIETIWQEDWQGEFVHELWESVERKCDESGIYIDTVEDDGSIYVVDTSIWERSEAFEKEQEIEDLNDEWSHIDREPDTSSADEARGYVQDIEALASAVETIPGQGDIKFVINQRVKFKQPDGDTNIHTIVAIGRDSDNDVWIKLDNMDSMAIFDWATFLVAVD